MYIEAIVLGFLIGAIRNGRIANFGNARFKGWIFILLAFLVFAVPYIARIIGEPLPHEHLYPFAVSVIVSLVFLMNLDHKGMGWMLIGSLLNLGAVVLNQFKMPIQLERMVAYGYSSYVNSIETGMVINYVGADLSDGWTVWLGKMIPMPEVYPLATMLSIGDIVIAIGIVILIQNEMLLHSMRVRGSMLQFSYRGKRPL